MSGSWGIELWDKYKEAYKVIRWGFYGNLLSNWIFLIFSDTADEFETVHKGFMKERSKLKRKNETSKVNKLKTVQFVDILTKFAWYKPKDVKIYQEK